MYTYNHFFKIKNSRSTCIYTCRDQDAIHTCIKPSDRIIYLGKEAKRVCDLFNSQSSSKIFYTNQGANYWHSWLIYMYPLRKKVWSLDLNTHSSIPGQHIHTCKNSHPAFWMMVLGYCYGNEIGCGRAYGPSIPSCRSKQHTQVWERWACSHYTTIHTHSHSHTLTLDTCPSHSHTLTLDTCPLTHTPSHLIHAHSHSHTLTLDTGPLSHTPSHLIYVHSHSHPHTTTHTQPLSHTYTD